MNEFSVEYAKALYALAKEENILDAVSEELSQIDGLLSDNRDYYKLLDTPAVSLDERLKLADEAFSSFSEILVNFIKILVTKKSFSQFPKCCKEFGKLYDEEHSIERVVAVTAVPLSEGQIEKLKAKIENSVKKTVFIKNEIDKEILGGVVLKLKNTQYDGSVRNRLKELEAQIQSHVF